MELERIVPQRRLEGMACVIIGGSSGIGLACARRFLVEGARVHVAGKTDDSVQLARAELAPLGDVHALAIDAAEESDVERFFASRPGRIDVLLHVAGISGRRFGDAPLHECTLGGWETVLAQNARSVFLTNRAAIRRMLAQEIDGNGLRGCVVNVGSVLATSPSPRYFGTYAYAASKGAIESMTRMAAAQYAPDRIRFNVLAPSLIETPMSQRAVNDPTIRAFLETKQPLAGGPGTVDDCVEAALFLCEPTSRFITGTTLTVDGGWSVSEGQWPEPKGDG